MLRSRASMAFLPGSNDDLAYKGVEEGDLKEVVLRGMDNVSVQSLIEAVSDDDTDTQNGDTGTGDDEDGKAAEFNCTVSLDDSEASRSGRFTPCGNFKLTDFEEVVPLIEGSKALLFRARARSERIVLKMVKKRFQHCEVANREFDLELSILENASHANIVRYLGSGRDPRRFVMLEYINQGTLGTVSNTNVSFEVVLQRARQLASAMHYLHEQCAPGVTIIHRDLKPDNIGLSDGCIKLFDFGLSICVKRRASLEETYEMTGATGTLRYMAPEVALHRPYNDKVDVYSFGVVLWQMLSRQTPYKDVTREVFKAVVIVGGMRPALNSMWAPPLQRLLQACWAPGHTARPSFADVIGVIDGLH